MALMFDHVGIHTNDMANSVRWYEDFFRATLRWELTSFSDVTYQRVPGITRLSEVVFGEVKVHLFETDGRRVVPGELLDTVQHVCLKCGSENQLEILRNRWIGLFQSGRYSFCSNDYPTEVVPDSGGGSSFYAKDVNGVEYELTYSAAWRWQ